MQYAIKQVCVAVDAEGRNVDVKLSECRILRLPLGDNKLSPLPTEAVNNAVFRICFEKINQLANKAIELLLHSEAAFLAA